MKFTFAYPTEGAPKGLVANASCEFDEKGSPFAGMQLTGFSIWKSKAGKNYASFPSRRYGSGYFDLLRPIEEGAQDPGNKVKDFLLAQYQLALAASAVTGEKPVVVPAAA
jgi:hypothetical protein